jgi:predicted dehydrogenase
MWPRKGTSDNPSLFAKCLDIGCHAIFLEKPGAPSVAELELMKTKADEFGVSVFMGFNKNVSKFVSKTRAYAKSHPGTNVTFLHNNNYNESGLNECFERNAEGMLKNMGKFK